MFAKIADPEVAPALHRLPPGEHRVALERVDVRESRRGPFVIATMRVYGSAPLRELGHRYAWTWNVGLDPGVAADYELTRCKEFVVAALGATGEPTDPDSMSRASEDPEHFFGAVLDVSVVERDLRSRPGKKVSLAGWSSQYQPVVDRWRTQVMLRPELAHSIGLRAEARALEMSGILGAESAQEEASRCMDLFGWCLAREVPQPAGRSV